LIEQQAGKTERVMQILRTDKGKKSSRLGQQVIEYAVILAAVSMALTVMYVYAKRGLQSTIKDTVDKEIGPQIDSAQILAPEQHQQSRSVEETVSQDTTRVVKNIYEAQYYMNSTTASTGISNTINNELR